MKKQNEVKNETKNEQTAIKPKRVRKEHLFFLYAEGNGFIHLDKEVGAVPNFTNGELLYFTSRASANFAREFFLNIKVAEEISIFAKVG